MARSYCITNLLIVVISLSLLPQMVLSSTSTLENHAPFSYYQTFEPSNLGITFQYPSNWNKFEAGLDPSIVSDFLGVASFDIVSNTDKRSYPYRNSEDSHDYSGLIYPILSMVSLKLPSHNLALEEYAKIRADDFRMLFSDFNLNIIQNNQSSGRIDGNEYWVFDYSFSIDDDVDRYGKSLWMTRGEKVYEISYIASGYDEYVENLNEIQNLIDTLRFID